jgi:hypothetical protein
MAPRRNSGQSAWRANFLMASLSSLGTRMVTMALTAPGAHVSYLSITKMYHASVCQGNRAPEVLGLFYHPNVHAPLLEPAQPILDGGLIPAFGHPDHTGQRSIRELCLSFPISGKAWLVRHGSRWHVWGVKKRFGLGSVTCGLGAG